MRVKHSYYDLYVRLDTESRTDDLTGLLNRRAWTVAVERRLAHLKGDSAALVLYLDVDFFKRVNDGGGHEDGDRLLVQVARALETAFGPEAAIGRMGGDEFVVFLDTHGNGAQALLVAHRGMETVRAAIAPVTTSTGGALLDAGTTLNNGVRRADAALMRAKQAGRDQLLIDGVSS